MWIRNKPYVAAKLYLQLTNKDLKKDFWRIYRFFKRQSRKAIDRLYNYLSNEAVAGEPLTLKQLSQRAWDWEKRTQADKEVTSAIIYDFNEARRRKQ